MASAYATFAARGKHCENRPVTQILNSEGKVFKNYKKDCDQVMQEKTADTVNDILRGVMQPGGFGQALALNKPSAGKTGTINSNMAVWFNGYTPALATAAMIAGANQQGHWITLNGQPGRRDLHPCRARFHCRGSDVGLGHARASRTTYPTRTSCPQVWTPTRDRSTSSP